MHVSANKEKWVSGVVESSLLNNENSRMIENKTSPPQALEIFDSLSASYGFSFKVRGRICRGRLSQSGSSNSPWKQISFLSESPLGSCI